MTEYKTNAVKYKKVYMNQYAIKQQSCGSIKLASDQAFVCKYIGTGSVSQSKFGLPLYNIGDYSRGYWINQQ